MPIQTVVVFIFGVVFVAALIWLAISFPKPTHFQYNVFRLILSLAAAGIAAMIPGFINIEITSAKALLLRAGGALAVFVVTYFFNPARLVTEKEEKSVNEQLTEVETMEGLRHAIRALSANQYEIISAVAEAEGIFVMTLANRISMFPSEIPHRVGTLVTDGLLVQDERGKLYLTNNVRRLLKTTSLFTIRAQDA